MTAAAQPEPAPHPLFAGASPAVVKQWLLPHDADRFVGEYQAALDDARTSLELSGVLEVVERWRSIAILQSDPAAYRRTVRYAAGLASGEPSPDDEPLDVTTVRAGQ
ncbi:DUF6247 family protein [Actinomycetospora aeridis]|uniref:DUF6247 family protein n=1 Tax=Actinomycetospora aeridis TaxID=3129231 RepID=A0ABU8NDY2_9PSEU